MEPPTLAVAEEDADSGESGKGTQEESQGHSQRLDWATLLHRVYDIDALRCECGGEIRFEEIIEGPKDAQAFLELHEIQSPRPSGLAHHTQPWSDAPNVALVVGRKSASTPIAENEEGPSPFAKELIDLQTSRDPDDDYRDPIPHEDAYFQDEIPPD